LFKALATVLWSIPVSVSICRVELPLTLDFTIRFITCGLSASCIVSI
jgi:hypothetical protein